MDSEQLKIVNKLINKAELDADKFTYPVFTLAQNDKPDLLGTCVILQVDGVDYIVTAAHVLMDADKCSGMIALGIEGKITSISSEWTYAKQLDGVEFDVAFTKVPDNLQAQVNVLQPKNILLESHKGGAHFCFVHGYPASKNKQNKALLGTPVFKSKSYSFVSYIKSDFENWESVDKNEKWHICSAYGKKQGNLQPIKPNGLSGGGLWIVPNITNPAIYLTGIFIEYHKNENIAFSTSLTKVVEAIKTA